MSEVLSLEQACEFLQIAKPTLYAYARQGKVPAFKMGKAWKFHKESLDEWVKGQIEHNTMQRKGKR